MLPPQPWNTAGSEPVAAIVQSKRGRFGVRGMQERALALGGDVSVGPRDDGPGTSVRLTLPLAAAE